MKQHREFRPITVLKVTHSADDGLHKFPIFTGTLCVLAF